MDDPADANRQVVYTLRKITLMFGGVRTATNNIISNVVDAGGVKGRNAVVDAVMQDEDNLNEGALRGAGVFRRSLNRKQPGKAVFILNKPAVSCIIKR